MLGSKVFGKKEVVSEILEHSVFKNRTGSFARGLVKMLGQMYIRMFGWPDQEFRTTFPKMIKLLQPRPSEYILDVGCGPGVWSMEMASRYGCTVTGVDLDEADIRFASKVSEINGMGNCRFICTEATKLDFPPESFDKIMCIAMLEHVVDDDLAVQKIAQALRRDGVLVGLVPNDKRMFLKPECSQKDDDPDGHGHVREGYSVKDIEDLMNRNGLQLIQCEYPHGVIESMMAFIQLKTNPYLAFPFTYPFTYLFGRFSRYGAGVLFKAVKRPADNPAGAGS
jgi:ubiquinone/menaquinone biosynthesis C-methylase UbiE